LESLLLARVSRLERGKDYAKWSTRVITALEEQVPLAQLVSESDVSHRSFITRFRNSVGLSPKTFSRVRRFQRVISALSLTTDGAAATLSSRTRRMSLAQLAVDAGYADQAHLCRDFVEFAGVSPSAYLQLAPVQPNHVPLR
jgi:AraC-like DNA-binding protein